MTTKEDSLARVRVEVDYALCEANGLCMASLPEVFLLEEDDTLRILLEGDIPPELGARLHQAIQNCPKQALSLRNT